jgi:hypothetical protein
MRKYRWIEILLLASDEDSCNVDRLRRCVNEICTYIDARLTVSRVRDKPSTVRLLS